MLLHNSSMLKNRGRYIEEPAKIHFIASKDFENVNFFQNIALSKPDYDFSNLQVWINDQLTGQVANSISAKAYDNIKIVSTTNIYPWFGEDVTAVGRSIDYIKKICEPLPLMYDPNNSPIAVAMNMFWDCHSLESIPAGLFDNNPQIISFFMCFGNCDALTEIPIDLFNKHLNVQDFSNCFFNCRNLIVNVQIGSLYDHVIEDGFAARTKERGTVYCREGSAAYTAFSESTSANVDVLTY